MEKAQNGYKVFRNAIQIVTLMMTLWHSVELHTERSEVVKIKSSPCVVVIPETACLVQSQTIRHHVAFVGISYLKAKQIKCNASVLRI